MCQCTSNIKNNNLSSSFDSKKLYETALKKINSIVKNTNTIKAEINKKQTREELLEFLRKKRST